MDLPSHEVVQEPVLRLSDLEVRARAAVDRMSKKNPHRQLICDLMTAVINLARPKDAPMTP